MDFLRYKTGLQTGLNKFFNLAAAHDLPGDYKTLRDAVAPILAAQELSVLTVSDLDHARHAVGAANTRLMVDVNAAYLAVKSPHPVLAADQAKEYDMLRHDMLNALQIMSSTISFMKLHKTKPTP